MRSPFPPPAPGGPTGDESTERLTVGAGTVLLAPVDDAVHLSALVGPIRRIPGIVGLEVRSFDDHEAVLSVRTGHPVLLASELRRVLAGLVRGCTATTDGGQVVVDARAPLPPVVPDDDAPDPAPEDPLDGEDPRAGEPVPPIDRHDRSTSDDRRASTRTGGLRGRMRAGRASADGADRDRAGGGSTRPSDGSTRTPGGTARPSGGSSRPQGGATEDASTAGHSAGGREEQARQSGAQYADTVVAALAGVIGEVEGLSVLVFDRTQRITAVVGAVAAEGSVLVGRPVGDAFAPEARATVLPAVVQALAGNTSTVVLPGGDERDGLEVRCRPVGGGHPGGVCLVRDLDAQEDAALLLEATRAFDITFRHSPIGQGLLSRSGRWLRVNGALTDLVGRTPDDLVGAELSDVLHPEDRDTERERVRRLADGSDDHHVVRARFLHTDGRAVHTHTRLTRITDDAGAVRGFVVQVVDAAAWKRFSGR